MLTSQKIEAHLSYAYLHAVASHSGIICVKTGEDEDDAGVDVVLRVTGRLADDSILTNFTVDVQLKATVAQAVDREGRYAFPLKMKNYNELRSTKTSSPQLLIVLYLPANREEWLTHSHESLVARRCAYWLSLRGAPESANEVTHTIYIPTSNLLSTANLRGVMTGFSRREEILYEL